MPVTSGFVFLNSELEHGPRKQKYKPQTLCSCYFPVHATNMFNIQDSCPHQQYHCSVRFSSLYEQIIFRNFPNTEISSLTRTDMKQELPVLLVLLQQQYILHITYLNIRKVLLSLASYLISYFLYLSILWVNLPP